MSPTVPMSEFSIEQALRLCAEGNRDGLKAIYDREAGRMLGVTMRMVKRRDMAEDIVQDVFIRIWNSAATYQSGLGNARAWIYTILRNRTLNILRGEARLDLTDDLGLLDGVSLEENPEEAISRLSQANALRRCLDTLDSARQHMIVLAYTQGLSHGEIAAKLNVPLGSVKSWLRRSLLALRECLG